ncbi:sigma-70 family RNA polymerase sigma factor [Salinisphaera sp. RV14]|uniref:sigma-70 family RNA polymerase sigma factor n=1 Tax=Salinisphaera sp. RV14 TaxID=3454140 RepID=UPI003F859BE5
MSDAMRPSSDSTPSAAEYWLQRHGDALYAFALARVFDRASAEDLVQDTLLAALRQQDSFRADSSERTWLIGILKHKCIDEIRRRARSARAREPRADDVEAQLFRPDGRWREPPATWADEPLQQLQREAFITALGRCLDGVPEAQRDSFVMRELHGLDADAASAQMGVTPNNLYVLLHRARLRLRRCLEKSGFMAERVR